MAQMSVQPECYPCLQRLIEQTVELATADPQLLAQARHQAQEILDRQFLPGAIPALIANQFHQVIKELTGNPDPFADLKSSETEVMRRLSGQIGKQWSNDLASLLSLAVIGNGIDFFRSGNDVLQELKGPVQLLDSDLELFQARLARRGQMLYLADNAGEQFFDLPLVRWLRQQGWQVTYVVKGEPIQNDLSRKDLLASGLAPDLEPVVDTGAPMVGLVLDDASPEFRRHYDTTDLILAKGMGHFETMAHLDDPRVFFLLQAKCQPIAQALGLPRLSFVFKALSSLG
ncbi:MAG: damage-control phosphatase ARMT1 family protein [Desulfobacteraceae bacterium]